MIVTLMCFVLRRLIAVGTFVFSATSEALNTVCIGIRVKCR